MKILHIANFNLSKFGQTYYAIDRKLSNGLIRNGHFVYDFSYRDVARSENIFKSKQRGRGKMNRRLLETIAHLEPDFLLLGHTELVDTSTLATIRKNFPDTHIAMWYVDPLFHEGHVQHILDRREYLDALFFTTGGELLEQFSTNSNKVCYMPNPVDSSIETCHNEISDTLEIDLLFCGRDKGEPGRGHFLSELDNQLSNFNFVVRGSLGQPLALGTDYVQLLCKTKAGLNLSRRHDIYMYSSDRIAQLTGNGILTFTSETPGMRRLYGDDEVVYFSDLNDLTEKARHFLQHDDERRRIAAQGRNKSHQSYNSSRIAKYILEISMGQPLTESYDWL